MPPDLAVFHVLRRHGVPFVVIGGHAVMHHGHVRATEDADAVWLRSTESIGSLVSALAELNAQYIGRDLDPATGIERTYPASRPYVEANHLMMLWTDAGFFDLFDYVPSDPTADVQDLFDTADQTPDGLRYASLEWLRRMKQKAGRPKDLDDLARLPQPPGT